MAMCLGDKKEWLRDLWIGAEHGNCVLTQAKENHVKFMSLPFIN